MKNITMGVVVAVAAVIVMVAPAMAAANLTSGSIGQRASDASTFGIAVCNNGATAQNSSVPVSITANGTAVSISSAAPIKPGACSYSYVSYASFHMIGGRTYSVQVSVNGGALQAYTVTMPGSVLGASTSGSSDDALRAQLLSLLQQLLALLQQQQAGQ
ncbi:MAG TPA: hypothetical protein VMU07_01240 [Candidatus Paceibacterota bacterium]|nr:hypothetical protein [Candidatus Paceibacterota bacterium]